MTEPLSLPPLITLEEHFLSTAAAEGGPKDTYDMFPKDMYKALQDLGKTRLESMTSGNVTLQVISHAPCQPQLSPEECRAANTQLHDAICHSRETRRRLAGFATLPMQDPDSASKELAHCIEEFGFLGALVDNHAEGRTYEAPEYRSFWYTVQSLGVPVYIHPTFATNQMRRGVFPDLVDGKTEAIPGQAVDMLMMAGWNWHSDVAMHVFKLFAAGVFDKFPRLKIVVGHFGEMIPYMLARLNRIFPHFKPKRSWQTVYDENLWITTSGVWSLDPLALMLRNTKKDRILYSVDYPFAKNEDGKAWMEELCKSGLCDQKTVDMIGYLNAERLLGVRVRRDNEEDNEEEDAEEV